MAGKTLLPRISSWTFRTCETLYSLVRMSKMTQQGFSGTIDLLATNANMSSMIFRVLWNGMEICHYSTLMVPEFDEVFRMLLLLLVQRRIHLNDTRMILTLQVNASNILKLEIETRNKNESRNHLKISSHCYVQHPYVLSKHFSMNMIFHIFGTEAFPF